MAYTYDNGTSNGKVRLLISDTDVSGNAATATFSDEDITDFLSMAGSNLFYAAALALESKAVSFGGFDFKTGDLEVDKSKAVKEMKDLAKQYRDWAFSTPAEYVDSYLYVVDKLGDDESQYINDPDTNS